MGPLAIECPGGARGGGRGTPRPDGRRPRPGRAPGQASSRAEGWRGFRAGRGPVGSLQSPHRAEPHRELLGPRDGGGPQPPAAHRGHRPGSRHTLTKEWVPRVALLNKANHIKDSQVAL